MQYHGSRATESFPEGIAVYILYLEPSLTQRYYLFTFFFINKNVEAETDPDFNNMQRTDTQAD